MDKGRDIRPDIHRDRRPDNPPDIIRTGGPGRTRNREPMAAAVNRPGHATGFDTGRGAAATRPGGEPGALPSGGERVAGIPPARGCREKFSGVGPGGCRDCVSPVCPPRFPARECPEDAPRAAHPAAYVETRAGQGRGHRGGRERGR